MHFIVINFNSIIYWTITIYNWFTFSLKERRVVWWTQKNDYNFQNKNNVKHRLLLKKLKTIISIEIVGKCTGKCIPQP